MEARKWGQSPSYSTNFVLKIHDKLTRSFWDSFYNTKQRRSSFLPKLLLSFSPFAGKVESKVMAIGEYLTGSNVFTNYDRRARVLQSFCDVRGLPHNFVI